MRSTSGVSVVEQRRMVCIAFEAASVAHEFWAGRGSFTRADTMVFTTVALADLDGEILRVRDVMHRTGLPRQTVSRVATYLIEQRLVADVGHPEDARAAGLTLTPRGRESIRQLSATLHGRLRGRII